MPDETPAPVSFMGNKCRRAPRKKQRAAGSVLIGAYGRTLIAPMTLEGLTPRNLAAAHVF